MPGTGYVTLTNRATGQDELVDADQALTAISSGKYLDPGAVAVQRNGMATYTTPDVAAREQTFAPVVDPAQAAREHGHELRERENTGAAATAKAFTGGAASGLTFGLVDPFAEAQEFNPIAAGAGQVAGAIAPAFAGDLGGLVGLGRDAAVADDALTAERAASGLSSKALYAGETAGSVAGGDVARAGKAIRAGATEAGRPTATIATIADAALPALEDLDEAGLKAARSTEVDAIKAAQAPDRERFVSELEAAHRARAADKDWLAIVADRNEEQYVRESAKVMFNADRRIRNLLDNRVGLAQKPERALEWLQQERQALDTLVDAGDRQLADYTARAAEAPEVIRAEVLAGKSKIAPIPSALSQRGIDNVVERELAERFPRSPDGTLALPRDLEGFGDFRLQSALAENTRLQDRVGQLTATPTSQRLQQIDTMLGERAAPHEASLGERVLHAVAPYAGPVGAIAEKAYAGLRKLVGAATKGASKTASSFADVATKAAPRAPLVASRVLASVAFAPAAGAAAATRLSSSSPVPAAPGRKPAAATPAQGDLAVHYQRVTDEIRSQTMYDATGATVMRPEARAAMAKQLDAIRAISPVLADRMETVSARRLEYLASIIPKLPDYGTMQIGPDRRRTPDLLMRSFARSVAAVEDPHAAMDRITSGRFVTEDAEALRAVYPEMVNDLVQQIVPQLATLQRTLPYQRRLSLSMLTGQPVDVAMTPSVLREIQSMYATEPGTAGGTQAPVPQPQFGSVKRGPGTPAQRRQGLTT